LNLPLGYNHMEITGTEKALATPLADLHAAAGAKLGSWFGCALPDDFGDWRAEYLFARNTVALIDKNYRAYLSFTGPDRVRYLNAILTNNIKDLEISRGNVSLLLNPQGRILAEIETYALQEKLFCVSYAMIREKLIETLDKYIIMDDVTLTDETQQYGTLALEGPASASLVLGLTGVDLNALPELGRMEAHVDAIPCTVVRRSPGQSTGAQFLVERQHLEPLWQLLLRKARAENGGPMGYTALSALRLEQGVPWFGYDFGEKQIPHEAGLQDTHISYTKGCYTGQEIVERVRSRGQVNRRRVDLIFDGTSVPAAAEPLTAGGKEVGYVTRAAAPPSLLFTIGMGYVRKENNAHGSQIEWSGGTARVSKFPEELRLAATQR
jgi:folate-binding protein YgfZ